MNKDSYLTKEIIDIFIKQIPEEKKIIFICQPKQEIFNIIYQISIVCSMKFDIIFIPSETYELLEFLSDNDLNYRFNIYNFNIDLIPIDNDLISLEKDDNFRRIYLNKEISPINDFTNSFIKLEACFGKVKHRYIKGTKAKIFNDLLIEKEKEVNLGKTNEILGMFVFDRSVDFTLPLVSSESYEGLIDEIFGINKGNVILEESYFKEGKRKYDSNNNFKARLLYSLNSNRNEFFSKIRCMNYLDANQYLFELRKYIGNKTNKENIKSNDFEEFRKILEEINNFVSLYRAPITINTKIMAEIINENIKDENKNFANKERIFLGGNVPTNLELFYSDYMSERKDLSKLIKLLCIESLTQGGIKDYLNIKRDILNIYGYQKIFLLRDLESIEFLKEKGPRKKQEFTYQQICTKLNLINQKFTKENISDCSYLYRGYCPIILRLIELALQGKWNSMKDIISKLPGDTVFPSDESEILKPIKNNNTIFVVFVGGVTYTEIEGIRYLNIKLKQMFEKNKDKNISRIQLIIVADEIINNRKIFDGFGIKLEQKFSYKKCYLELNSKPVGKKK